MASIRIERKHPQRHMHETSRRHESKRCRSRASSLNRSPPSRRKYSPGNCPAKSSQKIWTVLCRWGNQGRKTLSMYPCHMYFMGNEQFKQQGTVWRKDNRSFRRSVLFWLKLILASRKFTVAKQKATIY